MQGFQGSDWALASGLQSVLACLSLTLAFPYRGFLQSLVLSGETQERERILYQFSKRFHHCNPKAFPSVGREVWPRVCVCGGVAWQWPCVHLGVHWVTQLRLC